MAEREINIDLSKVTLEELDEIRNTVMKRLAARAAAPTTEAVYDRHGSGHSRGTPPTLEQLENVMALKR